MNNDKWKKKLIPVYGNVCWYCGQTIDDMQQMHLDHIIPKSVGGKTVLDNLALACGMCNRAKLDYDVTIFLQWLSHIRRGKFKCHILETLKHKLELVEEDCLHPNF